jgi:putative DNA primase/helicase
MKNATTDEKTIRTWYGQMPTANVGIATGTRSGLLVIDVDVDKGGKSSLSKLERDAGNLPATLTSRTGGGGYHFLYECPGRGCRNRAGVLPGIDVRGDGGYIVAPPSTHRSGRSYAWETPGGELGESIPSNGVRVVSLPDNVLKIIEGHENKHDQPRSEGFDVRATIRGVPEGTRDDSLFRLACWARSRDIPRKNAEQLVLSAATRCQPPFEREEALKKVENAYTRYEPNAGRSKSYDATTDELLNWSGIVFVDK